MTTFPLPTLAPTITDSGISAPSYSDILTSIQTSYRSIYGADVDLSEDTQDGQWLAVLSSAIDDSNQTAIAVFNSFSPTFARGVQLSSLVKINGLRRLIPTNSTCDVTITGTVGTVIPSGIVADIFNNQWTLPPNTVIPISGAITVTATCQVPGAISASPNTITSIVTIIQGWQTVNNASAAAPGNPIEPDSALRTRQAVSTSLPSLSVLDGIIGALLNLEGVERLAAYDNDTNTTDSNGAPAHTIYFVIQGGDAVEIATTVAQKKTPGTGTYGTTTEVVIDPSGVPDTINFFVLTPVTFSVLVNLKALSGFLSTTETLVTNALMAYLNGLLIGDSSYYSRLFSPANLTGDAALSAAGGLTQQQLDLISATYHVSAIAQARSDMVITGGPYSGGATLIHVTDTANFVIGSVIYITLDDTSHWQVAVSNVVGTAVTFAPAIPLGRSANNGALVYVSGDVGIAFNEASVIAAANIIVTAS